ncbi:MAG: hypothetical protein Q9M22_05150 [Mariprofundaceae bacterium]|nr:hypothetical protein [Mariprofundaceae bacterium]
MMNWIWYARLFRLVRTAHPTVDMNKTAVRKIKMTEAKNDFSYWQGQSFESRLEALEKIRNEKSFYHT